MNIHEHFLCAQVALDLAKEKLDRNDFFGSKHCITQAAYHSCEIIELIEVLELNAANLELTERGP